MKLKLCVGISNVRVLISNDEIIRQLTCGLNTLWSGRGVGGGALTRCVQLTDFTATMTVTSYTQSPTDYKFMLHTFPN